MNSVHVSCAWSGYAWSAKRAWSTSRIPSIGGRQARIDTASSRTSISAGSYKTRSGPPSYGAGVAQLVALLGFAFVSSFTPGPNNILLWASGATFGFRRTVPHVLGTAIGLGAMARASAAGIAALLVAVPALGV